jgi:hypothetical protein
MEAGDACVACLPSILSSDILGRRLVMKKVIALILFLLMASVASAGIAFRGPNGESVIWALPGDVVTINLVATGVCYGFDLDAIGVTTIGGPAGTATLGTFNPAMTISNPGYLENGNGVLIDFVAAYVMNTAPAAGSVLYTFRYQVPAIATYFYRATIAPLPKGATWYSVLDNMTYEVVNPPEGNVAGVSLPVEGVVIQTPEPMTLGLLGLGGLFLRRRLA